MADILSGELAEALAGADGEAAAGPEAKPTSDTLLAGGALRL